MYKKFLSSLFVVFFTLAAVSISLLCYYIWPEKDSTMPSWIQAIGSVAAIIAAIVIMNTQHSRSEGSAADQAVTERVNIISAVCFFAVEVRGNIAVLRSGITDGQMNRLISDSAVLGLRLSQASISDLPIWRCHIDEVRQMNIIQLQYRNLVTAIESFDAEDHRRTNRVSATERPKGPSFAASRIPELLTMVSEAINESEGFLRARYRQLAKQDLVT